MLTENTSQPYPPLYSLGKLPQMQELYFWPFTPNYLKKLASKQLGNRIGLTKVVDYQFASREEMSMLRSPS